MTFHLFGSISSGIATLLAYFTWSNPIFTYREHVIGGLLLLWPATSYTHTVITLVMTNNWIETIVLDVEGKTKKSAQFLKSHKHKTRVCTKHTVSTLMKHLEAVLVLFLFFSFSFLGLQRWCALRAVTTSGFRPNTFSSVCLEIIGPGSTGVYLSRLRSSQTFVTLSSTISRDTHFAWNTLGMPSLPSPHFGKTHSWYLILALPFMSITSLPQFPCLLLCLAAHFYSLSCLHPLCMCELGSELPVHEGKLILFLCTYS